MDLIFSRPVWRLSLPRGGTGTGGPRAGRKSAEVLVRMGQLAGIAEIVYPSSRQRRHPVDTDMCPEAAFLTTPIYSPANRQEDPS